MSSWFRPVYEPNECKTHRRERESAKIIKFTILSLPKHTRARENHQAHYFIIAKTYQRKGEGQREGQQRGHFKTVTFFHASRRVSRRFSCSFSGRKSQKTNIIVAAVHISRVWTVRKISRLSLVACIFALAFSLVCFAVKLLVHFDLAGWLLVYWNPCSRSRGTNPDEHSKESGELIQIPSKHDTLTQCRFNVGPSFPTLAQHWTHIGLTSRVCRDVRLRSSQSHTANHSLLIINSWPDATWTRQSP